MNKFSKITALVFAGMLALATGAQAGGLYDNDDNDDNDVTSQYDRKAPGSYCDSNDDDCDTYTKRDYGKRYNGGYYTAGRCAPLVRAVGKRNLVLGFARNSARFAWAREARFVHGEQYASWARAHDAHISCTRVGALNSCEATATPCY